MPTDIYNLLTGVKIDDATVAQLDTATGRTFVDRESIEFWQGILTLSHVMKAARTYPHGIVIPETGAVHIETIADSANATITPTGTEVWRVQNLDLDSCTASLRDADGNSSPLTFAFTGGPYDPPPSFPIYLSASMSLLLVNASGAPQTPSIAYHKVSL